MTEAQQRQWLAQWRGATYALAQIQREELARMTDVQALMAMRRVLTPMGSPYRDPALRTMSGLVEQQRLFKKAKTQ